MKYKLIKEYPRSPKLGLVVENQEFPHEGYFSNGFFSIKIEEITPYPELWEKVEELDYEVVEVFYCGQIRKLLQGQYRLINLGIGFDLDYILKNNGTIHSVKRLSDGEVFTIGDSVRFKPNQNSCFWEINNFFISKYDKLLVRSILNLNVELISTIKHKDKLPLFTTEDGVDIFEGNNYWFYNGECIIGFSSAYIKTGGVLYGSFSTKEKADEYVLMNTRCLSLSDVFDVLEDMQAVWKITELVKSRL
jgi:hypothetical protein